MAEKNLIKIGVLTQDFAVNNLEALMEIESDYSHLWKKNNFLIDLPEKWELSRYALLNNKLAGFLIASHKPECFYIHRFMIHNDFRGKGIGKILHSNFEESCRRTRKKESIFLRVYMDNLKAIDFYHSLGYEIVTQEKDQIEGDRYVMKRALT